MFYYINKKKHTFIYESPHYVNKQKVRTGTRALSQHNNSSLTGVSSLTNDHFDKRAFNYKYYVFTYFSYVTAVIKRSSANIPSNSTLYYDGVMENQQKIVRVGTTTQKTCNGI